MAKPYTWEEIKKVLKKELQKSKHILTYGTIGSCEINNDIDTIITKKPESKSSEFYGEVHKLFEKIDAYLREKYSCKLIRTSRFSDEEETKALGKFNLKDLNFQVMTYVSLSQIKKHWYADLAPNENLKDILDCHHKLIFGNKENIFKENFKKNYYDYLFIRLNDSDRINSNFKNSFLIERMNKLFDFILRKRLSEKPISAKNLTEVKKIFYKICDRLDRLEKNR